MVWVSNRDRCPDTVQLARRHAMQTRFTKLSHHPVFPLLALLAANVVFYVSLASTIA